MKNHDYDSMEPDPPGTPFESDWTSSPGSTIVDILDERGWLASGVAEKLFPVLDAEMRAKQFRDLTQGRLQIDEDLAVKLAEVLGAPVSFWLARERNYREDLAAGKRDIDSEMAQFDPKGAQFGPKPIPMVLHCPTCGVQHIDTPNPEEGWTNPPHRSHRCGTCFTVWRPADVPTEGVAAIQTRGEKDTWGDHSRKGPRDLFQPTEENLAFSVHDVRHWLTAEERTTLAAFECEDIDARHHVRVHLPELKGRGNPRNRTPEQEARFIAAGALVDARFEGYGRVGLLLRELATARFIAANRGWCTTRFIAANSPAAPPTSDESDEEKHQ